MPAVVRVDAATGAAIIDPRRAAATTAPTSDRDRVANGTREPLKDALWAPLVRPSKTRASSLRNATRAGAGDGGRAARQRAGRRRGTSTAWGQGRPEKRPWA